jgi:hypothetical protein
MKLIRGSDIVGNGIYAIAIPADFETLKVFYGY